MKPKFTIIALFFVFLVYPLLVVGQIEPNEDTNERIVKPMKEYPTLGVDIAEVSDFKIFNPKNVFHRDEILILDLALLTSANNYYYFPKHLENVDIIVSSNLGEKIRIEPIFISERFTKFDKYKNEILKESFSFLLGCESDILKKFEHDFKLVDENNAKDIFDRNLFWTVPQRCIEIEKPSELELHAEISNELVVVSEDKIRLKTAVGKIRSNTLKIVIK